MRRRHIRPITAGEFFINVFKTSSLALRVLLPEGEGRVFHQRKNFASDPCGLLVIFCKKGIIEVE